MTTRSFQAETIKEALEMVQKEMGPDAIVISARDIPLGPAWAVWKKPGVEVVSISADEVKKTKGKASKDQPEGQVLRPGKNGNGVEFVEETPEIEWESGLNSDSGNAKKTAIFMETQTAENKAAWKPRYLSKEDVLEMNQKPIPHPLPEMVEKVEIDTSVYPVEKVAASSELLENENCPKSLRSLLDKLASQEMDAAYLKQLKELALRSCSPSMMENENKVKEFLARCISANLPVKKWNNTDVPARVMVFVGMSGCGKTDVLAKIAIFYSTLLSKKVVWVCADTTRTGGIAEAKVYASAAGIPLEFAYTPEETKEAIEKHADADLILVDTPGFNPTDEANEVELGSFLSEIPGAQPYLVTAATAKESDTLFVFDSLKYFGLKGNVVTKLDETRTFGSVVNFTRKSGLPLVFFSSSRKANIGLKVADSDLLVQTLFTGKWK
jgi:flagellar biosynthesis protein FlhF